MDKQENIQFHVISQFEEQEEHVDQETYDTDGKPTINFRQFLSLIMAMNHFIICGIIMGYPSVFLAQAKGEGGWNITTDEASWIVSIIILPTAPACLLCGFLLTKFKKKSLLLIFVMGEMVSWLLTYRSSTVPELLAVRAFCGIPTSMSSVILPQYLGEISEPNVRGLYVYMVSLAMTLGVLVIHVLGSFMTWKACALITAAMNALSLCALVYLSEPYGWYMRQGEREQAGKAFYWYRGKTPSAEKELAKLFSAERETTGSNYTTIEMVRICCSTLMLMPLAITTVCTFTIHFSATKSIMYHSIDIISQVIPTLDQYTSTIIVDVVRLGVTALGCVLMKKFRVRQLFISSGIACTVSLIFFYVFYTYGNNQQLFSILALCALISHTVFSSIGLAPIVWVISGEIFPLIVKGIASGISTAIYYMLLFTSVKIIPDLMNLFGFAGAFLFFAACTIIGTIIAYFILPDTKNKTLKEIEDLFK